MGQNSTLFASKIEHVFFVFFKLKIQLSRVRVVEVRKVFFFFKKTGNICHRLDHEVHEIDSL